MAVALGQAREGAAEARPAQVAADLAGSADQVRPAVAAVVLASAPRSAQEESELAAGLAVGWVVVADLGLAYVASSWTVTREAHLSRYVPAFATERVDRQSILQSIA